MKISVNAKNDSWRFGLVWFYGILSILGYLMPNLVYSFLLDIYDQPNISQQSWTAPRIVMYQKLSSKGLTYVYIQLNDHTVLFQTIQFSISHFLHSF